MNELHYQLRFAIPYWLMQCFTNWLPDNRISIRLRGLITSIIIPNCGKNLTMGRDVTLLAINRLTLGDHVYLAKGTWINAIGTVILEDEVVFSPYVVLASSNHGFRDGSVRFGGAHPSPVHVGRGTWVGSHAVITAGVRVAAGNIVGANSVVTKHTEENTFVGGVPAKKIAQRIDNPSEVTTKKDAKDG